jgi:enoyl-CoA hydratase
MCRVRRRRSAQITANSPMGVWMTKEVAWSQLEVGSLQAGLDLENRTQIMTTFTRDHEGQVAAFLQRRPASYADE